MLNLFNRLKKFGAMAKENGCLTTFFNGLKCLCDFICCDETVEVDEKIETRSGVATAQAGAGTGVVQAVNPLHHQAVYPGSTGQPKENSNPYAVSSTITVRSNMQATAKEKEKNKADEAGEDALECCLVS